MTPGDVESPGPASAVVADHGDHCGPQEWLLLNNDGALVYPVSGPKQRDIAVRVGDTLQLIVTGNCAASVSASPQNARLRLDAPGSYRAVRPGRVRLVVDVPMCARPENPPATSCRGGVNIIGSAFVRVRG
jgi:hypothetical protein